MRVGGGDACDRDHEWEMELHRAIARLAAPAHRASRHAEATSGEYAAVLAALLLRRQHPWTKATAAAA